MASVSAVHRTRYCTDQYLTLTVYALQVELACCRRDRSRQSKVGSSVPVARPRMTLMADWLPALTKIN